MANSAEELGTAFLTHYYTTFDGNRGQIGLLYVRTPPCPAGAHARALAFRPRHAPPHALRGGRPIATDVDAVL
jgi:hypothetical protein